MGWLADLQMWGGVVSALSESASCLCLSATSTSLPLCICCRQRLNVDGVVQLARLHAVPGPPVQQAEKQQGPPEPQESRPSMCADQGRCGCAHACRAVARPSRGSAARRTSCQATTGLAGSPADRHGKGIWAREIQLRERASCSNTARDATRATGRPCQVDGLAGPASSATALVTAGRDGARSQRSRDIEPAGQRQHQQRGQVDGL